MIDAPPLPAAPPPDLLAVLRLRARGLSQAEIGDELGLDRLAVQAHLRRGKQLALPADEPPAAEAEVLRFPADLSALRLCLQRIGPLNAGQIQAHLEWEPRHCGQVLAEARRRGLVERRRGAYALLRRLGTRS